MTAAIMFSGPLWVCLLSIPLLGERVGPRRWAAILVGFFGILVVTRPWTGPLHWAVALSLGAALCGALYSLMTRMLAGRDSTTTQQFYAGLIATLGIAPLALADWTWPSGAASWFAFFAIGVFGWGGHQLLIIAHRFAPASTLAPFSLRPDRLHDRLELADLRPAAGRLGDRRRRHRRGERPLHLAARAQPRPRRLNATL